MTKLSDLNPRANELDGNHAEKLANFARTWQSGWDFSGLTPDENKIRQNIIQQRIRLLSQEIKIFLDECNSYCTLATLDEMLNKDTEVSLQHKLSSTKNQQRPPLHNSHKNDMQKRQELLQELKSTLNNYEWYLRSENKMDNFNRAKDRFNKVMEQAESVYINSILDTLQYYRDACALRDEQLVILNTLYLGEEMKDRRQGVAWQKEFVHASFTKRITPFVKVIQTYQNNFSKPLLKDVSLAIKANKDVSDCAKKTQKSSRDYKLFLEEEIKILESSCKKEAKPAENKNKRLVVGSSVSQSSLGIASFPTKLSAGAPIFKPAVPSPSPMSVAEKAVGSPVSSHGLFKPDFNRIVGSQKPNVWTQFSGLPGNNLNYN